MAERLDPTLAVSLRQKGDRLDRQLTLLGWYFTRFRRVLPASQVLRYEDIIATSGAALKVISASASTLHEDPSVDLRNRNANPLYTDRDQISEAADRLLQDESCPWWLQYDRASVIDVRDTLLAR